MGPVALGIHALRLLQKELHLFAGEDLRIFPFRSDRRNPLGGVPIHHAGRQQIGIERFQGGDAPGHAGGRFSTPHHIGYICLYMDLCAFVKLHIRRCVQIRRKLPYVPQIGGHCVFRGMLFLPQIDAVRLDIVGHSEPPPFIIALHIFASAH